MADADETIPMIRVWTVWYGHSHCTAEACGRRSTEQRSYDEFAEAATEIQQFLEARHPDCKGDCIVDLELLRRSEYEAWPDAPAGPPL